MSRSRWTRFLLALLAGAAAWAGWRFLPRAWLRPCCGGAPRRWAAGGGRGAGPFGAAEPPTPPRPTGAPAGSMEARVVEPQGGETIDEEAPASGEAFAVEPARCAAFTQGGTRCSREPEPGTVYCWQHAPS